MQHTAEHCKPPSDSGLLKHTQGHSSPNCLNNLHSVSKEQQRSSKAQDEFATGGFLRFVTNLLNEPTTPNE